MTQMITKTPFTAIVSATLLFAGVAASGGDAKLVLDDKCPVDCKEDPSWCEIFDKSTLYKNEDACLIQKVSFVGRYHGQYLSQSLEYSDGDSAQSFGAGRQYWENRRFRLGVVVEFLNDFTFVNRWNLDDNSSLTRAHFFDDHFETHIKWAPSDLTIGRMKDIRVIAGKQKALITREFATSSKRILTIERSQIVNEVAFTIPWGVTFGFDLCDVDHEFGVWAGGFEESNGFGGRDIEGPLWPGFDSRAGLTYRGAYDITDNTSVHFDYYFANNAGGQENPRGDTDELAITSYNHVFALGTESEWDIGHCDRKFGLVTDLIFGRDRLALQGEDFGYLADNNSPAGEDTFGFVFLPYYDLTERLQIVGKYAYSSFNRMQRSQRRVDDPAAPGTDFRPLLEDTHTFYLGLNYKFCGDNLKIMAGYEHLAADVYSAPGTATDNGSVSGDSWMFGVRTYW